MERLSIRLGILEATVAGLSEEVSLLRLGEAVRSIEQGVSEIEPESFNSEVRTEAGSSLSTRASDISNATVLPRRGVKAPPPQLPNGVPNGAAQGATRAVLPKAAPAKAPPPTAEQEEVGRPFWI